MAAAMLGVSRARVYQLLDGGKLERHPDGGHGDERGSSVCAAPGTDGLADSTRADRCPHGVLPSAPISVTTGPRHTPVRRA